MNYRLAKITGITVTNNKTGSIMPDSVQHYRIDEGEMYFAGKAITGSNYGKATWKASNCSVVKEANYSVDVRIN